MSYRNILLAMTAIGLTATSGLAATTINFESLTAMPNTIGPIPTNARLSNQLQNLGVIFSSGSPYVAVVDLDVFTASPPHGIGGSTASGNLTYNASNPVVVTFVDPTNPSVPGVTNSVSWTTDSLALNTLSTTLNAYDVNGALIATRTDFDTGNKVLSLSVAGIHSVQFLGTIDSKGVALDNLTFNTVVAAPEPATLAFLPLGVLTLLCRRRPGKA